MHQAACGGTELFLQLISTSTNRDFHVNAAFLDYELKADKGSVFSSLNSDCVDFS